MRKFVSVLTYFGTLLIMCLTTPLWMDFLSTKSELFQNWGIMFFIFVPAIIASTIIFKVHNYMIDLEKRKKTIVKTKEDKLALFNDTINYYLTDTNRISRSSDGMCSYSPAHPNTQGCAIGRLLKPKLQDKLDNEFGALDVTSFRILPKTIQGYGFSLLARLQDLHDRKFHWGENSFTDRGFEVSEEIRKDIENEII